MKNKVNEIRISYKERVKSPFWKKVNSSKDAAELLYEHWNKDNIEVHETFKIVLLNNGNRVKGIYQLSTGGITGVLVDVRLILPYSSNRSRSPSSYPTTIRAGHCGPANRTGKSPRKSKRPPSFWI